MENTRKNNTSKRKRTNSQQKKHEKRMSDLIMALLAVIGIAVTVIIGSVGKNSKPLDISSDGMMRVSYIDVGQGDCELIECDGSAVLIDGGESLYADFVLEFIKSRGITKLDCYIVSHPHSDHMGAASAILDGIATDKFVTTEFSELNMPTSQVFENMLDSLEKQPNCEIVTVSAGDSFEIGKLRFNVLAPFEETSDYNNMSVVLRVDYGDTRFLFTGDAEKEVETQMLENGSDLKADVLKVGHHGSKTSTSAEFLKAVSPQIAVISCGSNNSYGHPHKETTELLKRCGVTVCRTDEDGTVTVYSDGSKVITADEAA